MTQGRVITLIQGQSHFVYIAKIVSEFVTGNLDLDDTLQKYRPRPNGVMTFTQGHTSHVKVGVCMVKSRVLGL